MKKIILILLVIVAAKQLRAQSFSEKTNAVRIDYNQAAVTTTLPSIEWITPRIEASVSGEESIQLEATITSDVPLKEVKLSVTHGGETRDRKLTVTENQTRFALKQNLRLMDGDNTIRLLAENIRGGTVLSTRSILMGKDALADAVDVNRKDYAL